jgi:CysZ protein
VLRAIGLALTDLADGRVIAIFVEALAITLVFFVGIAALLFWLLSGSDPCSMVGMGSCELGTGTSGIGAILLTVLAAWFLFPAVAITVIAAFTDRICRAVEERHYPEAARAARPIGVARGALMGLKSGARLILFNLIALPFYLLLLVTGIGPFILFVIVNGLGFGRDLGELAAARHGDRSSRRSWLRSTRGQQHLVGTMVSLLFLVPFANLVAPVIGTAATIHLFNRSFWTTDNGPEPLTPANRRSAVTGEH